jgi:hypothetical protein
MPDIVFTMNAIIVSLKFNPGHFSHLTANYRLFEEIGYKPYLYINRSFKDMDEKDIYDKIYSLKDLAGTPIDAAVFWFPSLKNIWTIFKLRFFLKARVIYVYHEPFDSIRNYHQSGFGYLKIVKIGLINLVNIIILLFSNRIILPSDKSLFLYEKKYRWINNNYAMIPLLFEDEGKDSIKIEDKKYISYIGTVAADHAFDKFVNFAVSAMEHDWFPEHQFLIATSSLIPQKEKDKIAPFVANKKIHIQEGFPMTNSTINGFFASSAVVWNAYNRSMQSGVLPKSFMFGTPVLVLKRNANEFMENKITGLLIEDNTNSNEIKGAVDSILSRNEMFLVNCRAKFKNTFHYKSKIDLFKKLLE